MNPFLRRKTEQSVGDNQLQTPMPSNIPVAPSPFVPSPSSAIPFTPMQNTHMPPPPMTPPISSPPIAPPPTEVSHTPSPLYATQTNRHGMTASDLYRQPQQRVSPPMDSSASSVPEPDYTPAPVYHLPEPAIIPPEQRISGNDIPHPIAHFDSPVQISTDDPRASLPLAGDPITVFEGQNSSPAFIRPTTSVLAEERSMMNAILSGKNPSFCTGLGVVLTPFAKNTEIPQATFNSGIPRCSNCRGYINCYTEFIHYGESYICNLCGTENVVPDYYRAAVDGQGRPVDIGTKIELQQGSYEAVVDPAAFNMKEGESPVFVFMLDVSVNAMNSGLCVTAIQALKASLQILCEKNNNTRVGFVIMDTRAHFISFRGGRVHDSICGDFTSSFDCVSSQAWLTPVNEETLPNLNSIVDFIHSYATAAATATHCILMSCIKAVSMILRNTGGRIVAIVGNDSYGEGSSQVKEGIKMYGTTEEGSLYNQTVDNEFLTNLTSICINSSISIDLIAAGMSQTFFALNYIESLISNLGGTIYYKPTLSGPYRDHTLSEIHAYIQVLILNETYRSFSARLRLSEGLSVAVYRGGLMTSDNSCYTSSCVTSENSVVAEIEMDRYIKGPYAYAQYAVLYINDLSQCCIRVFNYRFQVSTNYSSVYHGIDFSAYFMLLTRACVGMIEEEGVYKTRETVSEVVATVLASYRNSCCYSSSKSQLALPESLSLLPLFLNSLLKSPLLSMALMNTASRVEEVYPRGDERVYAKWLCYNCTLERVLDFIYPHFYQLKEDDLSWGVETDEFVTLPTRLPLSGAALSHDGIFLLTGREGLCMIVGKSIPVELCQRVFNTTAIVNSTYAGSLTIMESEDPFVIRIQSLLYSLRDIVGEHVQVRVVLRGENEMTEVSRSFRDDRCGNDSSLSEFVCSFYKKVLDKYK